MARSLRARSNHEELSQYIDGLAIVDTHEHLRNRHDFSRGLADFIFTASFLKKKSLFTDQAGEKEDRRVRQIKIGLDHPEQLLLNARVECVIDISRNSK